MSDGFIKKLQGFWELCVKNQGQRPNHIFLIISQPINTYPPMDFMDSNSREARSEIKDWRQSWAGTQPMNPQGYASYVSL